MNSQLIQWDVYEIYTKSTPVTDAMFRGRIRKLCLEKSVNVLVENSEDIENRVRFAVTSVPDYEIVSSYIKKIAPDAEIELKLKNIANPVISKLKVNIESRYTL
ncbi:hypothetical protein HGB24_01830 [Candidatus Saccharibacteria bacterium]|nr:hypothetical protein [Candidatus Saccharibacteria bacterium]